MTMTQPNVSVLMPVRLKSDTYRECEWLFAAIQSVLKELRQHEGELIIIDDKSEPPIEDVISGKFGAEKSIKIIRNERNYGLIRSLNRGLGVAEGQFIARVDADDTWAPNCIKTHLSAFKADSDLGLSFGSMNLVSDKDEKIDTHIRSFDWEGTIGFSQNVGCAIPHGSIMIRKDILKLVGGYPYEPASIHSEDFNLWSTISRFFKVCGHEEILLNYRVHDKSVSADNQQRQSDNTQIIMDKYRKMGKPSVFVSAHQKLVKALDMDGVSFGHKLYELWRFGGEMTIPRGLELEFRRVLFDRVCHVEDAGDSKTWNLKVCDF